MKVAKVIIPLSIVGLGLYGASNIELDNTIKINVGRGEVAIHITKEKDYLTNKLRDIKHTLGHKFEKAKSSLKKDKFVGSNNLEDMITYAKKLPVSPKAMPIDKMINILNEQYTISWPERPIDEKYFITIMNIESKYDPKAYNSKSGATGLSGFLRSSWHKNSKKSFKYATDPEENIKALLTMTKKNLDDLQEHHPKWENLTEVEQYIQIGLAHSAGFGRMQKAGFDPYKISKRWIRKQSIDYQVLMKDYLTR